MNNEIYFLADYSVFKKFNEKNFINFYRYYYPAFRQTSEISLNEGGFLLRSEYPYGN